MSALPFARQAQGIRGVELRLLDRRKGFEGSSQYAPVVAPECLEDHFGTILEHSGVLGMIISLHRCKGFEGSSQIQVF
jgi:hypothetical protein